MSKGSIINNSYYILEKNDHTVYPAWALAIEGIQGPINLYKDTATQREFTLQNLLSHVYWRWEKSLVRKGRNNWNNSSLCVLTHYTLIKLSVDWGISGSSTYPFRQAEGEHGFLCEEC